MFYSNNRDEIRKTYYNVWQKYHNNTPLEPLEQQILNVILAHPEYHALLAQQNLNAGREYPPELGETNPFLHMGLHLAIREQVATNRPKGIARIYQNLSQKLNSQLEAEHQMMEHLVEAMWQAQRNNHPPDEKDYLKKLKKL